MKVDRKEGGMERGRKGRREGGREEGKKGRREEGREGGRRVRREERKVKLTRWRSLKCLTNLYHVDNNSLNSITLALNLHTQ